MDLKLKSDKLEELSMIDSLTNIPNRRFFNETFEKKYREILRDKRSLALIMIDVDFFKLYNDNYGHWQGDECLRKVAQTLRKNLKRPTDTVSRYGGEEFVVLLKDIDRDGAKKVVQSLIDAVANLKIEHKYSTAAEFVTISAGLSIKESDEDISKEDLLKIADNELYRAKESGRNKFCAEL